MIIFRVFLVFLLFFSQHGFAECFSDYKQLLAALNTDDAVLKSATKHFFIEEQFIDEYGNIKERNKLEDIPDKYTYDGRLFPNSSQQQANNIVIKNRLSFVRDVRNASEKVGDDYKSNYWFWKERGCWYLKQRTIHLVYVKPEEPKEAPAAPKAAGSPSAETLKSKQ